MTINLYGYGPLASIDGGEILFNGRYFAVVRLQ